MHALDLLQSQDLSSLSIYRFPVQSCLVASREGTCQLCWKLLMLERNWKPFAAA